MDFNVIKLKYKDRIRNLNKETKGKVKSKKYFPVFNINGEEYIFKPLSKSKPFCTPTFAFSEVFWSNIINKYFDENAPVYKLAICDGYEEEENKYRNQGTIVKNITKSNQKLVNLLEYFNENNDPNVDIYNYINYCGKYYDYTNIFNSNLIKNNIDLGEELSKQVLISILKGDINYHYENVNYIYEDNKLKCFAPPIDHEFSSLFIYPDNKELFYLNLIPLVKTLQDNIPEESYTIRYLDNILNNINLIVSTYPNVVKDFIDNIDKLLNDINKYKFNIDKEYLYKFSSFDFEDFKNESYFSKRYNPYNIKIDLNTDEYFKEVVQNCILLSNMLKQLLVKKLDNNYKLILK